MNSVYLHIWTPAEGFWADGMRAWLGESSSLEVAFDHGDEVIVSRWTFIDEEARGRGLVVRLFGYGDVLEGRGDVSDDRNRFWPRISFSTSSESSAPTDLFTLDHTEVVGGIDDLWFHFVGPDPRDSPYTVTYREAVDDSVWGIEEGYVEAGDFLRADEMLPSGWWVTVDKQPGPRPSKLHSVF